MHLQKFYESVLPAQGQFILFQNKAHTFHATIEELVAATEKRIDTQGLYFATAAYGPEKNRTQANVRALRAFRFDIDAGAEKFAKHPKGAYPTQKDALAALIAWVKDTGLMPTWIVSSGEGLHVYWSLTDDMDPLQWRAAAAYLQLAGTSRGLKVDSSCTSDTARVLRPIGTLHKNGSRVSVLKFTGKTYDPAQLSEMVADLAPEDPLGVDTPAPKLPREASINDDILHVEGPPASLARVAEHCSAVALMRDKAGNVPEPHWRAVMGVAKYCEDGEQLVHEWSSGYESYNPRETQEKFDRWETPPTTCQHFSMLHTGCNTCPYRGKITTPKQVGYIAVAPAEPAPEPVVTQEDEGHFALPDEEADPANPVPERPDLFDESQEFFYKVVDGRWTLHHRYQEKSVDATGQAVFITVIKPVCNRLFWVESQSLPGASENNGVMVSFAKIERTSSPRRSRMEMAAGNLADVRLLCKFMAEQGIYLTAESRNKKAPLHLQEYVRREMNRRSEDMRFVLKDRFGYHYHEGQFLCALGRYVVYPDSTITFTAANSKLSGQYTNITTAVLDPRENRSGSWKGETWRTVGLHAGEYVSFLRKHYGHKGYENARLAIAINLSSPFLTFAADSMFTEDSEGLPATGFVLSMYSEASGIGKSSIMSSIAAAYGRDSFVQKGGRSITDVAASTLAVYSGIYPFLMDEVSQNDVQRTLGMIDMFANGKGRVRAKNTGVVTSANDNFALVLTVATNVPQRELLAAGKKQEVALQRRLLELSFDDLPHAPDIAAFRADLKKVQAACGAYGLVQALKVVTMGPQRCSELASENVMRAFDLLGVDQTYRFYARMLGAMLTCQQVMGPYFPFDMDELVQTMKRGVHQAQAYVQESGNEPEAELAALVNDLSPWIPVTRGWTKRTGRNDGSDVVLNPTCRTPYVGREVQEWGEVLIEVGAVRRWCIERNVSTGAFLKRMAEAGLLVVEDGQNRKKYRITTGIVGSAALPAQDFHRFKLQRDVAAVGGDNVVALRPSEDTTPKEIENATGT